MASGTTTSDLSASSISTQADEQGAKHDAGPWAVCANPPNPHWYHDQTIFSVSQGNRVADLCTLSAAYEANGRLIAAAPDMLEALQAVMNEWREGYGLRCEKQVRAAIAKAAGGKS